MSPLFSRVAYWATMCGMVALLGGTLASSLVTLGKTPAFMYGEQATRLTTLLTFMGLPAEWFGLLALAFLLLGGSRAREAPWVLLIIVASPVAGFGGWLVFRPAPVLTVPLAVAWLATVVVVVMAAVMAPPISTWGRRIAEEIRSVLVGGGLSLALLGLFMSVAASGVVLQRAYLSVPASEAGRESFVRWFLAQGQDAPVDSHFDVVVRGSSLHPDVLGTLVGIRQLVDGYDSGKAPRPVFRLVPLARDCAAPMGPECLAGTAILNAQSSGDLGRVVRLSIAFRRLGPETDRESVLRVCAEHAVACASEQGGATLPEVAGNVEPSVSVGSVLLPRPEVGLVRWALDLMHSPSWNPDR